MTDSHQSDPTEGLREALELITSGQPSDGLVRLFAELREQIDFAEGFRGLKFALALVPPDRELLAEALDVLAQGAEAHPGDALIAEQQLWISLYLDDQPSVRAAMDRLEQSAADDPKKLAKLGGLVLDLDDERDHARALLERALALEEPATAGFALYHLARLELAAGNPNEALARFLQVQAETMMGWLGRFGASHVHLARDKAGSLGRVEEELARMRDTYPAFDRGPDFLLFRAEVALAGERLDEARELVARVLAERPPDYDFGLLIRARRLRERVVI